MEAAITTRLERVVQEVIEVRKRAETLSEELEQVRAERGALQATLEEERAALTAARASLEAERATLKERRTQPVPEPTSIPIREAREEEPLLAVEAEAAAEPRLPSPRKLLGKLKFVGRNKGKAEEPAPQAVMPLALLEEEAPAEPEESPRSLDSLKAEALVEIFDLTPESPAEVELELNPIPASPVEVKKPRAAKTKKAAPPPRFAPREFLASLPGLDDDQLDLAAFGIVQLDDQGAVIALNRQGAMLLGVAKSEALDQALFTALLPDEEADVRFAQGVVVGKLDTVFTVEGGLTAHLFRHAKSRTNWALLRKQEGDEA